MPEPYYSDDLVALHHGDAMELLPTITADVLVTDPPYGVGLGESNAGNGPRHGLTRFGYASHEDTYDNFVELVVPILDAAIDATKRAAVFTGPHVHEQRKPDAIGGIYSPAAAGRHRWGFKTFLPVLFYGTAPGLHKGSKHTAVRSTASAEPNGHPCPKPIEWMAWLIDLAAAPSDVVFDPFAGSGTTLVAAKRLGRRAIGVEIEERYCEIAARRLDQGVLDFGEVSA